MPRGGTRTRPANPREPVTYCPNHGRRAMDVSSQWLVGRPSAGTATEVWRQVTSSGVEEALPEGV